MYHQKTKIKKSTVFLFFTIFYFQLIGWMAAQTGYMICHRRALPRLLLVLSFDVLLFYLNCFQLLPLITCIYLKPLLHSFFSGSHDNIVCTRVHCTSVDFKDSAGCNFSFELFNYVLAAYLCFSKIEMFGIIHILFNASSNFR